MAVKRKRGYLWSYLNDTAHTITFLAELKIAGAFWTERELKNIYKRFEYPLIYKL